MEDIEQVKEDYTDEVGEWPRIIQTELGSIAIQLDPDSSMVVESLMNNTVMIPEKTAEQLLEKLQEKLEFIHHKRGYIMKTLERLLLADSVLQELIEQGVVTEEEVQEIAEEQAETSSEHIKNFREQMGLDE